MDNREYAVVFGPEDKTIMTFNNINEALRRLSFFVSDLWESLDNAGVSAQWFEDEYGMQYNGGDLQFGIVVRERS